MKLRINQDMLFLSAVGFYENGILLAKKIDQKIGEKSFEIAPVAAVNISFAAELLLKLLYYMDNNKTVREHKLDKIFFLLDNNLKKEIEDIYNENKRKSKNDIYPIKLSFNTERDNPQDQVNKHNISNLTIENLLKIHSNGFIKWRYAFEIEEKYYDYEFNFNFMSEFINALMSIIEKKISRK